MQMVLADVAGWPETDTTDPVVSERAGAESFVRWSRPTVAVASVEDVAIRGARGLLWIRVYRQGHEPEQPILYIHGGGWSAGSITLADRFCRRLCSGSGCLVASVGYGLAPEEPYPFALEDCVSALTWLVEDGKQIGADGDAPFVIGESAGANLAAALCLRVRDARAPAIAQQVLVCPVLDDDLETNSHQRWGGGEYLISSSAVAASWRTYLGNELVDAFAAPLRATDLTGLPAATIIVAGCDPLHDDGVNFARRLTAARVPVELIEAPGLLHGFIYMDGVSEAAARMVDRICALHSSDEQSED
jgi:acetyl esterase